MVEDNRLLQMITILIAINSIRLKIQFIKDSVVTRYLSLYAPGVHFGDEIATNLGFKKKEEVLDQYIFCHYFLKFPRLHPKLHTGLNTVTQGHDYQASCHN